MRSTFGTRRQHAHRARLFPPTLAALNARLAQVEADCAQLRAENADQRAAPAAREEPPAAPEVDRRRAAPRYTQVAAATTGHITTGPAATGRAPTSRRHLLGLGAKAAVAAAAAGVLAEQVGTRTAFADNLGNFTSSVSGTPAVFASGTNGADGVDAYSDTAAGVYANSGSGIGVSASSGSGYGVYATTTSGVGVNAYSASGVGVGATTSGASVYGVHAVNSSNAAGSIAILGRTENANAALGPGIGVVGETASGTGVQGTATTGVGVSGTTAGGAGSQAMFAAGASGSTGLRATSDTGNGIVALSTSGTGINVQSGSGSAVIATSGGVGYGLYLTAPSGWAIGCVGRIRVLGNAFGTATLAGGTTTKTVITSSCDVGSLVILTPTSDPGARVWAVAGGGAFTINASIAPATNVVFTYLLIN